MAEAYAVTIHPKNGVGTVSYETEAEMRAEITQYLCLSGGSNAVDNAVCMCRDFVMVCQPRDSLEATVFCSDVFPDENPFASFALGLKRGDRIYGPAFVVRKNGDKLKGMSKDEAERIASIIRNGCKDHDRLMADANDKWAGTLAYVEEFGAGKGMAYFLYGSENLTQFIGWDRSPREQYSEPPFETPRISVEAVGYQLDGLVVTNRGKSVEDMHSMDWFLFNRKNPFETGVTETVFTKFVLSNGGKVFVEKEK